MPPTSRPGTTGTSSTLRKRGDVSKKPSDHSTGRKAGGAVSKPGSAPVRGYSELKRCEERLRVANEQLEGNIAELREKLEAAVSTEDSLRKEIDQIKEATSEEISTLKSDLKRALEERKAIEAKLEASGVDPVSLEKLTTIEKSSFGGEKEARERKETREKERNAFAEKVAKMRESLRAKREAVGDRIKEARDISTVLAAAAAEA